MHSHVLPLLNWVDTHTSCSQISNLIFLDTFIFLSVIPSSVIFRYYSLICWSYFMWPILHHLSVSDCPISQRRVMLIIYLSSEETDSDFKYFIINSSTIISYVFGVTQNTMTVIWHVTFDLWNSWFYVPQLFVTWNIQYLFLDSSKCFHQREFK